jgi:hypothetical protein
MVYDKLINKANAYNPFLIKMNYKISFKTWLKHARKILNEIINPDFSVEESKPLFYNIEIEVETEREYTSEEEEPKFAGMKRSQVSFKKGASGIMAKQRLARSAKNSGLKMGTLELFKAKM